MLLVGAGQGLAAPAARLTAQVGTALGAASVLLTLCLVATLALIVPAELAARRVPGDPAVTAA
jgi:hypothetical protein